MQCEIKSAVNIKSINKGGTISRYKLRHARSISDFAHSKWRRYIDKEAKFAPKTGPGS